MLSLLFILQLNFTVLLVYIYVLLLISYMYCMLQLKIKKLFLKIYILILILGPLPFNIYLSDLFLFFENSNIVNYADDNSPFACETDNSSVWTKILKYFSNGLEIMV